MKPFHSGIRTNLYKRHTVSELPRATLPRSAPAIMSYMAFKLTVSVMIPGFLNDAKTNHESLY